MNFQENHFCNFDLLKTKKMIYKLYNTKQVDF